MAISKENYYCIQYQVKPEGYWEEATGRWPQNNFDDEDRLEIQRNLQQCRNRTPKYVYRVAAITVTTSVEEVLAEWTT